MKKNVGKYTSTSQARERILAMMQGTDWNRGVRKSSIGYAAFPDYNFYSPQAAAFSVAKIVRDMEKDKLIRWNPKAGYSLC